MSGGDKGPDPAKARLLLLEDDVDLRRGVRFNLEHDGYLVVGVGSVAEARAQIASQSFDLLIFDLNLPDGDGLDLLRERRSASDHTPIVCLTARGQESDAVMGFGLGADDYVRKPFGVAELLARVAAVLRRAGHGVSDRAPDGAGDHASDRAAVLHLGDARVDLDAHRVQIAGREEEITPMEKELLLYLHARRGRAVDRQDLLRDLWGQKYRNATRTLDNHVARLRRKIEVDPAHPKVLCTVHGVGYRLSETP